MLSSIGSGAFEVTFNSTIMLHGVYGGEDGIPVNEGDFLGCGYYIIFNACAQQPILIKLLLQHAYCQLKDGGVPTLQLPAW